MGFGIASIYSGMQPNIRIRKYIPLINSNSTKHIGKNYADQRDRGLFRRGPGIR